VHVEGSPIVEALHRAVVRVHDVAVPVAHRHGVVELDPTRARLARADEQEQQEQQEQQQHCLPFCLWEGGSWGVGAVACVCV
jgi:hypothetical protein